MKIDVKISENPLEITDLLAFVASPTVGGTAVFVGTVRDSTKGKRVVRLEFEAYEKMALLEMQKIAEEAFSRWPIHAFAIHHRVGGLAVGEAAVIIAAGSAHRDAAFDACRFGIDTLKKTVPIWKKEVFEDGETWVAAHP